MGSMSVPCFRAKRQNPKFGGNTLGAGGGGVADLAWEWYSVPTVHCYNGAVLGAGRCFFFAIQGPWSAASALYSQEEHCCAFTL